jgi:hypothetical protein
MLEGGVLAMDVGEADFMIIVSTVLAPVLVIKCLIVPAAILKSDF